MHFFAWVLFANSVMWILAGVHFFWQAPKELRRKYGSGQISSEELEKGIRATNWKGWQGMVFGVVNGLFALIIYR